MGLEKKCIDCNSVKPLTDFHKAKVNTDGYKNQCKICCKIYRDNRKEAKRIYDKKYNDTNQDKIKEYRENNIEKIKRREKLYRGNNKEIIKVRQKTWGDNNKNVVKKHNELYYQNNKQEISDKSKIYRKKNKEQIGFKQKEWRNSLTDEEKEALKIKRNNYEKNRKSSDSLYKLKCSIRSIVCKSILNKISKTSEILGCSFEEFKIHIESQWEDWMNWDNYGNPKDGVFEFNKTWDIDHIIPLSSANNEFEIIRLNHHTNLQPLCSYTNRFIKKDIYE